MAQLKHKFKKKKKKKILSVKLKVKEPYPFKTKPKAIMKDIFILNILIVEAIIKYEMRRDNMSYKEVK